MHPMIAIDSETEAVLGLIDTKIWTRSDAFYATAACERTLEDKESMRFPFHSGTSFYGFA